MTARILTFILLVSIICGACISAGAQTTRQVLYPQGTKNQIHKEKSPCAVGWRGIVTLSKTLKESLESDDPGIRKSIDRIKHKTSRDYEYSGRAIVDGTDPR